MRSLDLIGASLDLTATILFIRANLWAWPVTILSAILNGFLYYHTGLYGDAALSLFYGVISFYGWFHWVFGGSKTTDHTLPITRTSGVVLLNVSMLTVGSITFLGQVLQYSSSTVAYWDAAATVLSLVAQWMLCRKKIENWLVWFSVDVLYVFLYLYKGLPYHSITYMVFTVLAIIGFISWSRELRSEPVDGIRVPLPCGRGLGRGSVQQALKFYQNICNDFRIGQSRHIS